MREPSRTEAAKLTHTCRLVDEILILRMVKMKSNLLFRNQRVMKQVQGTGDCVYGYLWK